MKQTNFQKVKDFHHQFGMTINNGFDLVDVELRFRLIFEELQELEQAVEEGKSLDIAKELTDLLYVVYGAGVTWGIDLDETLAEVHESNMSKLGDDGKPIYREDGKVLKGPNYRKANLAHILFDDLK